jgi:hypothetical protein
MKQAGVISTTILSLLFGTTVLATAQQDQQGPGKDRGNSKPAQQSQQARPSQQAKPSQPTQQARPAQPSQQKQPGQQPQQMRPGQQERQQQTVKPALNQGKPQQSYGGAFHGGVQPNGPTYGGVHNSGVPQQREQVRKGFSESRAGSWKNDHQNWHQRGGYTGYRIPENRFRLYFGRDHFFRIYGLPLVFVGGQPRFQYDGYWVTIVDPWPESWGPNWYETDDVYLDNTGDGYYLYDRNYPDYPIAVTVSF